jgi:putative endonuclease
MSFWVYILQSETSGLHYCGQTTDVERRLRQHNDPEYSLSKTTKRLEGPWKLIWSEVCGDRSEATQLERKIKKRGIERILAGIGPPPLAGQVWQSPPEAD